MLHKAAEKEGINTKDLEFVTANVDAGGVGIHNGRTWHGSQANSSKIRPRRGIGIHFVPSNAVFRENVIGKMWLKDAKEASQKISKYLPDDKYPVTFKVIQKIKQALKNVKIWC